MTEPRVESLLRSAAISPLSEHQRVAHKQALRALVGADPDRASSLSKPQPVRPLGRWRRAGIVLVSGGLVLAGAGTATGFLTRAEPEERRVVRCFSVAAPPFTLGAPGSYDISYSDADDSVEQTAAYAIELCGAGWEEGSMPWPETKPPGYVSPEPQPVPELQACILPEGIVGVFPGDPGTCLRLGLPTSAA